MNIQRILRMRWLKKPPLVTCTMLIVIISVACTTGLGFYIGVRQLITAGLIESRDIGPVNAADQTTPGNASESTPGSGIPVVPGIEPTLTAWDGAGRVTILLLGLDYRDWEAGNNYSRSDTMILLTLDPLSFTAGILSVPRDLWVAIPGFSHAKINTAHYLGDAYKLPGGGPGLAVKTVEQFLGVPIHYYARIDFGAFVRFIDEIGGVKIDVPEPITIDLRGSAVGSKKTLQPGVQVLPGEWALAYARARYTEGGDFDRAERQQQVILAIRDRILSLDMLPILINKASVLYQELSSGIHTNLDIDEAIKLALLASKVKVESINRGVIGDDYVIFGRSPDNLSILIPIPDKIHVLRDAIFASTGSLSPMTPGTIQDQMLSESAIVTINGSSLEDLLERTVQYLRSMGVNVSETVDGSEDLTLTTIIDHSGKPYTRKYLVELLHISGFKIYFDFDPNSRIDIEVILGRDWATDNSMP